MNGKRKFPLRWIASVAALALGEAVGLLLGSFAPAWPAALFSSLLVALFGYGGDWRGWRGASLALLGLGLALHAEARRTDLFRRAELGGGPLVVDVTVGGDVRRQGDWVSFDASVSGVDLAIVMPVPSGGVPRLGERWRVAGWLERKNRDDRRRRNLWVKGQVTFAERLGAAFGADVLRLAARVRRRLSRAVATGLGERNPVTALHRAMLLGERASLPKREKENFISAGTMHVFAISGLHVGVVAALIVVALMCCLVPVRIAGAVMVPILWFYVLLIGMPPSAVRAALMASCYSLAPLFWRRADGLVAWCQAFLIVHLAHPAALFSVGSALSFAVMLMILLYDRWAKAARIGGRWWTVGFLFAVWAAGTPIAAHVFGRVTPGGMLANVIVVPLAGLSVACGFMGTVSSLACPWLGAHLNRAAALVTDAMRGISAAVASLPGANFETEAWTIPQCALWYLTLLLGAFALYRRRRL